MRIQLGTREKRESLRRLAYVLEQIPGVNSVVAIDPDGDVHEWSMCISLEASSDGWGALKLLVSAIENRVSLVPARVFEDGTVNTNIESLADTGVDPDRVIQWLVDTSDVDLDVNGTWCGLEVEGF